MDGWLIEMRCVQTSSFIESVQILSRQIFGICLLKCHSFRLHFKVFAFSTNICNVYSIIVNNRFPWANTVRGKQLNSGWNIVKLAKSFQHRFKVHLCDYSYYWNLIYTQTQQNRTKKKMKMKMKPPKPFAITREISAIDYRSKNA